jgi:hypothetical protein
VSTDPTVRGPRLLPEAVDSSQFLGTNPAGGRRFLAGGLRVLALPGGAVRTSLEPLPESPKSDIASYALPTRLGGGFLFLVQPRLYRSESWLAAARPIYASPSAIAEVLLGLDRAYVRAANGSITALDPRTGDAMDLGPWPDAPSVLAYRAVDGWLAVAIADLRGAIVTYDAGATWKPLALPIQPKSVEVARMDPATGETWIDPPDTGGSGGFVVVRGTSAARQPESCFAIRADEPPSRLARCPRADEPVDASLSSKDAALVHIFGARPFVTAVEDGWPLDADTALVARDGALGQLRLSDGQWTATNLAAFPSKPARCHPMPILVDAGAPALGFACAEPSGRTAVYRYDPSLFALTEVRSFDGPRAILSFANGAIAVRGACDGGPERRRASRYCVLSRRATGRTSPSLGEPRAPRWIDVELPSFPVRSDSRSMSALDSEDPRRLLVFDDGRVGVLSPPRGKLATMRLEFLGEGENGTVGLDFPDLAPEVERALASGVWLDGFEERKARIASGWVEAAGAMIGVDVEEGGRVRVGDYVRDAGDPVVSGPYGLGWGDANRAYETTDGGATWTAFEVPKPLSRSPGPSERACGPVGCMAKGWVRVGWGKPKAMPQETLSPVRTPFRPPRDLDLVCVSAVATTAKPGAVPAAAPDTFYGIQEPPSRPEDLKVWVDADGQVDRAGHGGPLARIYAWGPRSDDWTRVGRWTVRWLSPFGGPRDVESTAPSLAPFVSPDAARRALGHAGSGSIVNWSMTIGDEMSSALLLGRRLGLDATVLQVDAERSPLEVRRGDGEPFADIDFAMKAGGHWYLSSREDYGEAPASVVFRVDGGMARPFARIPRATRELRPSLARLAARTDGRAIGLVVDGQPPPDRAIPLRWVLPLDIESGAAAEPERLGAADLGGQEDLSPCREGDTGWILDTAWAGKARIAAATLEGSRVLTKVYLRARLSTGRACVERLSGSLEGDLVDLSVSTRKAVPMKAPVAPAATLVVSALHAGGRTLLRCGSR